MTEEGAITPTRRLADREQADAQSASDPGDSRRADARARELAQTVFDHPLVLEAGAGTGKTSALVARIVAWCIGQGWELAVSRRADNPPLAREASVSPETVRERIATDVLSRVAAITFTEAAAAEMAERTGETFAAVARGELRPGLLESALPADGEERAARARALLGELDHLAVRTIHAWCRGLLARYPLEAGLHPAFSVDADMRLQAEVVREVVEESVRAAYASDGSPLLQLALEGHGAVAVEETLAALVAEGVDPVELNENPFTAQRVERHLASLRKALGALRECDGGRLAGVSQRAKKTHAALRALEISEPLLAAFKGSPASGENRADGLDSADLADSLDALCEGLAEIWHGAPLSRIREWSKAKLIRGESEALDEDSAAFVELARALLPELRSFVESSPGRVEIARRALAPMLERVESELRRRGIATFASLLRGARDLLQTRPDISRRVRLELDQLLVDEFQDTDDLQCSIVRHLALSGPASERPGLFLVGDPKQSIYGWRSADLACYDDFVREVEQAGGESHSLSVNFRSVPAILAEVERAIEPVMHRERGLQPRFETLHVSQALADAEGFRAGGRAPVEYWVSWGFDPDAGAEAKANPEHGEHASDCIQVNANLKSADATRMEAEALAVDLADLHQNEGVAWRDMVVLFRGMGDLEGYLAALRERGVPYAVERDRNYYRRREVIDAAAFVRCVLDPNDQLALVTALRSPAVGVPDAALIPLWSRAFPARVAELHGLEAAPLAELDTIAAEVVALLDGPDTNAASSTGSTGSTGSTQSVQEADGEIPGLERIRGWESSLRVMLENLAALRESFDRDAADVFVERLRTHSLLEVSEAARYLGAFRVANLERFFRELRAGLVAGNDPQALLRRLRGDVADGRDEEEQRPVGEAEDAVPVMTIHKAKGLDFEHVYLVQLHKRSRAGAAPATAVASWQGALEYRLFGQATLGFESASAGATRVEAAERVRTLYVAMTRAKQRLVLMGSLGVSPEPVPYEVAASHSDLLAGRFSRSNSGIDENTDANSDSSSSSSPEPLEGGDLPLLMQACAAAGEVSRQTADALWVFPALAPKRPSPFKREPVRAGGRLPGSQQIAREVALLAGLRAQAATRMKLRWGGAATSQAHASAPDEPLLASARPLDGDPAIARGASLAAGEAIHRTLEELNLESDPQEEFARQREKLAERIPASAVQAAPSTLAESGAGDVARAEALRRAALERARALLDRFAAGALAKRLWAISRHIVARELEVWLPGAETGTEPREEAVVAPLRFVSGQIDLVYRDPSDGTWVVADYKSDRVTSQREIDSRAEAYSAQAAVYTRAVQEAFGLAECPRFELWFLEADLILVSTPDSATALHQ